MRGHFPNWWPSRCSRDHLRNYSITLLDWIMHQYNIECILISIRSNLRNKSKFAISISLYKQYKINITRTKYISSNVIKIQASFLYLVTQNFVRATIDSISHKHFMDETLRALPLVTRNKPRYLLVSILSTHRSLITARDVPRVTICWRIDSTTTTTREPRACCVRSSMLERVDRCTLELFLAPCLFVSFIVPGCYPAVIGVLSVPNDTSMTTALLTPTNERGVGGVGATRDRASSSRAWGSPLPPHGRRIHVERMRSRSTRSLRVATSIPRHPIIDRLCGSGD